MTVYLVEERGGSYEDCWEQIIKCFSDNKLAEEFAKSKNEYYNYIESFRKDLIDTHDLFNVLMDKYWFNRRLIDKLYDDYPMEKDNSIFKTCVKDTLPELWEKYTEKEWDDIWEYYMRDDDKVQNGNNKYRNSYLRYFVLPIQVENSGLVSIEKAAEWVKNSFKGTFGEGLAENIKQEFIETMTK